MLYAIVKQGMIERVALIVAVACPQFSWYASVIALTIACIATIKYIYTRENVHSKTTSNIPHTLYSLAFVWPNGLEWNDERCNENNVSPRLYAERILSHVEFALQNDHTSRFIIHTHGGLSKNIEDELLFAIRATFQRICARVPTDCEVQHRVCNRRHPPFWPEVVSVAPLFDCSSMATVVVGCNLQTSSQIEDGVVNLRCNAYTTCTTHRSHQYVPSPMLIIDTSLKENEAGIKWRVTANGCTSSPTFRALLHGVHGMSFETHTLHCFEQYDNMTANMADMILEQYMRPLNCETQVHLSLLRAHASLVPMVSTCTRSTTNYKWSQMTQRPLYDNRQCNENRPKYVPHGREVLDLRKRNLRLRTK